MDALVAAADSHRFGVVPEAEAARVTHAISGGREQQRPMATALLGTWTAAG